MQIKGRPQLHWSEMAPAQKGGLVGLTFVQLALLTAALWDLHRRPAAEVRGNKWLWTGISFVNFIGPITYFIFGRKKN